MDVRMLNTDRRMNTIPDQNTMPSAVSQGTFIPNTTLYVKKAFIPIPGARTIGFLAYSPMAMLEKALTSTVAVSTAEKDMPSMLLMMAGFTTIMYMVARNVVIPAITSVLKSEPDFSRLKNVFMCLFLCYGVPEHSALRASY